MALVVRKDVALIELETSGVIWNDVYPLIQLNTDPLSQVEYVINFVSDRSI